MKQSSHIVGFSFFFKLFKSSGKGSFFGHISVDFLKFFFSLFFFLFNLYKDVSCLFTEEPMGGDLSWW